MRKTRALKLFIMFIRTAPNQSLTASHTELMDMLFMSERGVYKLVKRLENLGFILVSRAKNKPNTYSINENFFKDK
mgnify:CR=1 FL=1